MIGARERATAQDRKGDTMVRISVPLPETTWKGLRRVAEQRRVTGRASLSVLSAQILREALVKMDAAGDDAA